MALFEEVPDNPDGLVAIGGDLRPATLLEAYRAGVFPWPIEGYPLTWFSPPERAILEHENLHLGRSLEQARRRSNLGFTTDKAFHAVIQACRDTPRPGQDGTWITPEMLSAYTLLHKRGVAHSFEAWNGEELVAGLYGVDIDGAFAAESMFHRQSNASKLLLLHLMETFHERGLDWIDIQVPTPHLERLGARVIPRDEFLKKLVQTRALGLRLFPSASSSR